MRIVVEIALEAFAVALFIASGTVWLLMFTPGF